MTWTLIRNPGYEGQPRILTPPCHDFSAFITIECSNCGSPTHLHETQIAGIDAHIEIEMRCPECLDLSAIECRFLLRAFKRLRKEGWIK